MRKVYATFDQDTLDREYSPSSRVADIEVFLQEYRRRSDLAIQKAQAAGLLEQDVRYGPTPDETMDVFSASGSGPAPLQIYIHGGYWQLLSKDDSSFAAPMFQRHGAAFAAVNYSLAPAKSLSAIVEENRRAIRYLHDHAERWNVDRGRLFLSGSSAGAHLVMMMLRTGWNDIGLPADCIKGVCAVSGLYDLEPVRLSYVNDNVQMDADEARANSPIHAETPGQPSIIMAYGDNETAEFKRQTDEYCAQLEADGHSVAFREIENRNHFDVIMDLCDDESWLGREVLRQMGLC